MRWGQKATDLQEIAGLPCVSGSLAFFYLNRAKIQTVLHTNRILAFSPFFYPTVCRLWGLHIQTPQIGTHFHERGYSQDAKAKPPKGYKPFGGLCLFSPREFFYSNVSSLNEKFNFSVRSDSEINRP